MVGPGRRAAVARDRNGLEVMTRAECLELLVGAKVGRLAFVEHAAAVIVPVNFALLDDDIVIRTGTGSKLRAVAGGGLFSFEADAIDLSAETGWSVVVSGPGEELRRPDDIVRAEGLGLRSWAREARGRFIRIRADTVDGRRLPSAV